MISSKRYLVLALAWFGMAVGWAEAQERPLPGLAIDGRDVDRPWGPVIHLPSSVGVFGGAGTVSGGLEGVVETELDEGAYLGGGVQGRMGSAQVELGAMQVEGVLEGGFVAGGQVLAVGSDVTQRQVMLRGWRELFRWEGFFGLTRVDFGLRLNAVRQEFANATSDLTVEMDSMVPGMELVFDNRKVVGGEWGIHSRTALVMGQGNGARERTVDWRIGFNYPLFGGTFQRTDVMFGYRYVAQELTFYSVKGERSTRTDFGLGGPELTVSVRF